VRLPLVGLHSIGLAAGACGGLLCLGTAPLVAQESCVFLDPGNDLLNERPPFTYISNPHLGCEGGVVVWGDSAIVNRDEAMFRLIGSVRYRDASRELTADEARYFFDVGRLQAQGRVHVASFEDGSTVENGDLVYLRQTDTRAVEEMTVTTGSDGLRPRATVYPRRPEAPAEEPVDGAGAAGAAPDAGGDPLDEPDATVPEPAAEPPAPVEPAEPEQYLVVGDRLFFLGDEYFNATGSVEIQRDSLMAFADSAEYTGDRGELVLNGAARVQGSSYDLVGRAITLTSAADGSDEVRALREAVLTGDDLNVRAPQIVLHLADGELERMVAIPLRLEEGAPEPDSSARRPVALSQDIELTGDSLDVAAATGVIERIFAAGAARSVSSGRNDLNVSSLPDIATTDWIDADTIEVILVPVVADSAAEATGSGDDYEVERIIARVGARSLYRLLPSDSTAVPGVDPPAVSYMVADQITIFMADGQAERVESHGQVSGWHLEPIKQAPADSTSAPEPDSSALAADSLIARASASTVPQVGPPGPSRDDREDEAPLDAYLTPASTDTRTRSIP